MYVFLVILGNLGLLAAMVAWRVFVAPTDNRLLAEGYVLAGVAMWVGAWTSGYMVYRAMKQQRQPVVKRYAPAPDASAFDHIE